MLILWLNGIISKILLPKSHLAFFKNNNWVGLELNLKLTTSYKNVVEINEKTSLVLVDKRGFCIRKANKRIIYEAKVIESTLIALLY